MSLITRVYYIILPNQLITQEQIHDQLKVYFIILMIAFVFNSLL
jgi:hypothetical protein